MDTEYEIVFEEYKIDDSKNKEIIFTREDMEQLRISEIFNKVRKEWNKTKVNNSKEKERIYKICQSTSVKSFEDWERYFYENIISFEDLTGIALHFKAYLKEKTNLFEDTIYDLLTNEAWIKFICFCLIYDVWIIRRNTNLKSGVT